MLTVETIARVRREQARGKSVRAIARDLRLSRDTVTKYLRSGETAAKYERHCQPYPQLGPFLADLEELLERNGRQPRRDRLDKRQLFEALRRAGYAGGYDAVRRYARRWADIRATKTEAKATEAFIPLTFAPAVVAVGCGFVGRLFRGECLVLIVRAVACEFVCRQSLLAAKVASARRGSRMRSTGEAGMREAHVLDARLVVSPKMLPAANGCRTASV